jgi:integrase
MAVKKIKNSWWVDFRSDYIRYRKRSPENTKAGAEAYEATLRHKLARGESIDKKAEQVGELFTSFAWKWFEEYVISNNKPSEQRTKKYILSASLIPFFGKISIEQITAQHIEQYKAKTIREGVTNKTINNRLTVLRKCICTAYEWLELTGTPPKVTWLKCTPPRIDYLTLEESEQLLRSAEGIVHEMLLMALRTGMRQGELKGLQWSSIDWQSDNIVVRHSRNDYTQELGSPKNNRERYIPMDSEIRELLLKRKKDKGYVFLDYDGKTFNTQRLKLRMSNVCKTAGLRKVGWHKLRHTFASHLVMNNVHLAAVQKLMGHLTITTTMKYAHLSNSILREAIDTLGTKHVFRDNFGQPVGNQQLQVSEKPYAD